MTWFCPWGDKQTNMYTDKWKTAKIENPRKKNLNVMTASSGRGRILDSGTLRDHLLEEGEAERVAWPGQSPWNNTGEVSLSFHCSICEMGRPSHHRMSGLEGQWQVAGCPLWEHHTVGPVAWALFGLGFAASQIFILLGRTGKAGSLSLPTSWGQLCHGQPEGQELPSTGCFCSLSPPQGRRRAAQAESGREHFVQD